LQTIAPFIDGFMNDSPLQPTLYLNQSLLQFADITESLLITSLPVVVQNITISVSVCMSAVCLFVRSHISPHVQNAPCFLNSLHVAVA